MAIGHLILKFLIIVNILWYLRFEFQKFRISEILNFYPCFMSGNKIKQ